MPIFNMGQALGVTGGATGTTAPVSGSVRRSPAMKPIKENAAASLILQELVSRKRVAPTSLNSSSSSLASSDNVSAVPFVNPGQPTSAIPGCSKWSAGVPLAKKLVDLEPPSVHVGSNDPLGIDLVELRHSSVFETKEADMAARKYVIHRENLANLETLFKSQQATARRIKVETNGECTGDFPVENEYVVSADIRTPVNKSTPSTINERLTASKELPIKAKVLFLGDSTLTYGHSSKAGNTFFAKFAGPTADRLVPCPVLPINLTQLGDDQEFELYTFAISGLSAVLGLTWTPAEVKRQVYEAFGANEFAQFTLIEVRIGANDLGSLFQFSDVDDEQRSECPEGYPKWLSDLYDKIVEWCQGLAVEFDCAVSWVGAGCLPKISLPGKNHCNKPLHVWSYPRRNPELRNKAYNEFAAAFIGLIIEKSTGEFVPVKVNGVASGHAKFCSFAAQLPPGANPASGTGHPGQRHMARMLGNMLNCAGILLCKVANNPRYVTYYIENAGVPPRWGKEFKVIAHAKFRPLPESEWGANVNRLTLTKQSDWPQCLCKGDDSHVPAKRDYETRSAEGYTMVPGQLVRIKLGSGDNFVYHGAMVIATVAAGKLICVSLLDKKVHLLAPGKVYAFAQHHALQLDDKERHENREAKGGKGRRYPKRAKK
jgi:hypothetical protein